MNPKNETEEENTGMRFLHKVRFANPIVSETSTIDGRQKKLHHCQTTPPVTLLHVTTPIVPFLHHDRPDKSGATRAHARTPSHFMPSMYACT